MSIAKLVSTFSNTLKKYPNFFSGTFYVLVLILCFDQLTVGNASVKWDAFRLWFPWKHFIVNELLNGDLPLWNPFHLSGFPQHGDSMTWYPISWILGFLTGGYNLLTLNLEYLLHLFLAGFGFYKLMSSLRSSWGMATLLGLSYMLSGFMIGNAQHLGWVVSAAWLPWLLMYLRKLVIDPNWKTAHYFVIIGFLFFSGGYLAIFFITLYFIVAYFIYAVFSKREQRWKILLFGLYSLLIIALLSAPILFSIYNLSEVFDRTSSELINETLDINFGGTPLNGILAAFLPFASGVYNVPEIEFGTFSTFFGSAPLLLIIISLKRIVYDWRLLALLLLGIFLLLVSVGDPLPFRELLGNLPFLDLFRYPTIFRLFSIFIFLALVGIVYKKVGTPTLKKFIFFDAKRYLFALSAILLILLVVLCTANQDVFSYELMKTPSIHLSSLNVHKRVVFSLFILLSSCFAFLIGYIFYRKRYKEVFGLLWILELVIAAHIAAPSVVNEPVSVHHANYRLDQQPISFKEVVKDYVYHEKNDWKEFLGFAWQGKSILLKQPSQNGFSPIKLKSTPIMQEASIKLPDSLPFISRVNIFGDQLEVRPLKASLTISQTSNWKIKPKKELGKNEYFAVKQRKTPGWKIHTNDLSSFELETTAGGFMLVRSNDSRTIHLVYSRFAYQLAVGVFLFSLFIVIILIVVKLSKAGRVSVFASALFVICILLVQHYQRWFPPVLPDAESRYLVAEPDVDKLVNHIDSPEKDIYLIKNKPKTDYFLDILNFYYKRNELYLYKDKLFRKYSKKDDLKEIMTLKGKVFEQNNYLFEIKESLKKKIGNSYCFIKIEFEGLDNKEVQVWLNHSKDGEWLNGKAWHLKDSFREAKHRVFVRSIDLNNYNIKDGSELKLYLSSIANNSPLTIHKISFIEYPF